MLIETMQHVEELFVWRKTCRMTDKAFSIAGQRAWNDMSSPTSFRKKLKIHFSVSSS